MWPLKVAKMAITEAITASEAFKTHKVAAPLICPCHTDLNGENLISFHHTVPFWLRFDGGIAECNFEVIS